MMEPFSPDDISRQDTLTSSSSAYQAEVQRKKLLDQSDAVMLLFNPWSKESFEWVNGNVVADIINTGRKEKLKSDIVGILDGLVAAIPGIQRSKSTRSARSTKLYQKELSRTPSFSGDAKSGVSLFSGLDEKRGRGNDYDDYDGELKRISIVVEGSALKRAEFMIHERDLPPPPEPSPAPPRPLVISGPMSLTDKKLPTIREVDSNMSLRRHASMMDKHKSASAIRRRDSAISFRTTSSAYSQASSTVVEALHGPSMRESNPFTLEDLVDAHMYPNHPEELPEQPPERRVTLPPLPPAEELEIPVLVVASMTDRLKGNGGMLPRMVSASQGQELARKFGSNSAYIEVSAKSNANVDEAFGILVDQVMSKRASRQKDQKPSGKVKDVVILDEEDEMDKDENDRSLPARAVLTKVPRQKSRSCMPAWWDNFFGSVFSWGPPDSEVSAITFEDIGARPEREETREDVWGETVVVKNHDNKTSWYAMRKSREVDPRQSVSTVSTDGGYTINGFSIITPSRIQREKKRALVENPFNAEDLSLPPKLPAPPPVYLPEDAEKHPRSDEALMDRLDRKLSKKNRPDSMTLGQAPSKAAHADPSDETPRRNEAILDKVTRKAGLNGGPLALAVDEKPQPALPVSEDNRPLSVDSSIARTLARNKSSKKQKGDRSQPVYLTNYYTEDIARSRAGKPLILPLPGTTKTPTTTKALDLDDGSSSIITTSTAAGGGRRRQHTSLISELPPTIPPLRFDAVRFLDGSGAGGGGGDERRFTVMIRLAEQELEQQRARVYKLVSDDAAAAAPVTRSHSVGAGAGSGRRASSSQRPRGVGTNAVGPVRATATANPPAVRGASSGSGGGPYDAVVVRQPPPPPPQKQKQEADEAGTRQQQQQQQQVTIVHVGHPGSRANAVRNRPAGPMAQAYGPGQGQALVRMPLPPPRRAATLRAVPPPTPPSRPRTRPNSERRPAGRPTPVWI
ncbi:hypothetical protein KVR01_012542 [Diaporthe batatas]|uniref:uncharacterized protein n=1 Tax=Diaporthe batatas TaxID=748121 RepID=UPI001D0482DD|nr:uncharacterized protein KVR01_012542 [Diaporthe batatas]KAG8157500.1 hypothetical protein KVR01_012542 [Diaporthe batatas]